MRQAQEVHNFLIPSMLCLDLGALQSNVSFRVVARYNVSIGGLAEQASVLPCGNV